MKYNKPFTILVLLIAIVIGCNEDSSKTNTDLSVESENDSVVDSLRKDSLLDSIAKSYLINTNRFYDGFAYMKLGSTMDGDQYQRIVFGRDTEFRFIPDFSIYINEDLELFEYNKLTNELDRYTHDESRKCDIETLLWIDSLLDERDLNEKDIYTLFESINPHCKNNVEYSQMVNEYLWKALINQPDKFVWSLRNSHLDSTISEFIVNEIGSPINDNFQSQVVLDSLRDNQYKSDKYVKLLISELTKLNEGG